MFWRVAVGILVAPLTVSVGMVLTTIPYSQSLEDELFQFLGIAVIWYLGPLLFTIVFALPSYLLLNYFGWVRWWVSLAAGLLIGGIAAATDLEQGLWYAARLVVFGGLAGLVFWRIISTYRPPKATW